MGRHGGRRAYRARRGGSYIDAMSDIGRRFDETGMLLREDGGFVLRRDSGGRIRLELRRVPVDHVNKRVRVVGIVVADGLVDSDGVAGL